ncbi:MAG: GNAT family N-acetyltransferase [Oscillospiraceae bacterium]|nr:GNAT family N-acetyltransferase [Oscillospiraceae bacterium]
MEIRRFKKEDSAELAEVIAVTLRTTNIKDYTAEYIENDISFLTADKLVERDAWTNIYVVIDEGKIIGCGAIGPYWGKEDESSLYTVFVLPEYQGKGIGRKIIDTLEQDEYFLRAKRIEVPASITALEFYRKMGYDYKNGVKELDEDKLCHLEKFR